MEIKNIESSSRLVSSQHCNSSPLVGPGKVVKIDEATFGKGKFNRGAYREGMWCLVEWTLSISGGSLLR